MLRTVDELIDALGGTKNVAALTRQKPNTVCNWRARQRIPADHFLILSTAIEATGQTVSPNVFGVTIASDASPSAGQHVERSAVAKAPETAP